MVEADFMNLKKKWERGKVKEKEHWFPSVTFPFSLTPIFCKPGL